MTEISWGFLWLFVAIVLALGWNMDALVERRKTRLRQERLRKLLEILRSDGINTEDPDFLDENGQHTEVSVILALSREVDSLRRKCSQQLDRRR